MKINLILVFLIIILFSNCTVTSEKYRYKWRIQNYLNLLTKEELEYFKNNKLDLLGKSFDSRINQDSIFSNKVRKIQEFEAITIFNGEKMGYFYRYTLLKELNRDNFYKFMNYFNDEEQKKFAYGDNFVSIMENKIKNDESFKRFIHLMTTEYKLLDFNLEQVYKFFREVSFPEVSRREVYHLLKVLKEAKALDDFKNGELTIAADKLNNSLKGSVSLRYEFERIRRDSSLNKLKTLDFLDVYYNVIMKEMDKNALRKTLEKF